MSETSAIPSWAVPGAKVVCVTDIWSARFVGDCPVPSVGSVYTISHTGFGRREDGSEHLSIAVNELDSYDPEWGEFGYEIIAFRPLVTRSQEQDAAIFRKLLDTQRIGEDA